MKRQNGITLIALVITIIVLLILAGVAISMLSGDNGILRQAASSKEQTEKASDLESIKIAVAAALTEGLGKVDLSDNGDLEEELNNVGITGYEGTGIIKLNNEKYIVSENGVVTKKIHFTAENYGDTVNYNGSTDWQIFYDDGQNVYLISKDYVEITNGTAGMTTSGYNAWWASAPKLGETRPAWNCVKSLTTKDNWITYVDTETADYATGAPTLDMWVASWNEKNALNPTAYKKLYAEKIEGKGYYIGTQTGLRNIASKYDSTIGGYYVSLKKYGSEEEKTGYYDTLYFNDRTTDITKGYWLAAPSVFDKDAVMSANYAGDLHLYQYTDKTRGIRPIVCLKSTVKFEQVDGIWNVNS